MWSPVETQEEYLISDRPFDPDELKDLLLGREIASQRVAGLKYCYSLIKTSTAKPDCPRLYICLNPHLKQVWQFVRQFNIPNTQMTPINPLYAKDDHEGNTNIMEVIHITAQEMQLICDYHQAKIHAPGKKFIVDFLIGTLMGTFTSIFSMWGDDLESPFLLPALLLLTSILGYPILYYAWAFITNKIAKKPIIWWETNQLAIEGRNVWLSLIAINPIVSLADKIPIPTPEGKFNQHSLPKEITKAVLGSNMMFIWNWVQAWIDGTLYGSLDQKAIERVLRANLTGASTFLTIMCSTTMANSALGITPEDLKRFNIRTAWPNMVINASMPIVSWTLEQILQRLFIPAFAYALHHTLMRLKKIITQLQHQRDAHRFSEESAEYYTPEQQPLLSSSSSIRSYHQRNTLDEDTTQAGAGHPGGPAGSGNAG